VDGGVSVYGISADYIVVITGIDGVVTGADLYAYPSMTKVRSINAAVGHNELETGVSLSDIGLTGTNYTIKAIIVTTDWQHNSDVTDSAISLDTMQNGSTRNVPPAPTPLPEFSDVLLPLLVVSLLVRVRRRRQSRH